MIDVASFKTGAETLATMLREGRDESACFECGRLLQLLTPLMSHFPSELQVRLVTLAKHLLQCQERHDWVGLCDYLEYELPQLLDEIELVLV